MTKQCPFCAEDIQDAAIICKHCGRELPAGRSNAAAPAAPGPVPRKMPWIRYALLGLGVLIAMNLVRVFMFGPYVDPDEPLSGPTADVLYDAYRENPARADENFTGRRVMVDGVVSTIETDALGFASIVFDAGPTHAGVIASLPRDEAARLSRGDHATVICTIEGRMAAVIHGTRCRLQQSVR